jgi:hypothetical protein
MLNSFADSTGLHVNYHKSNIYPINVSDQKLALLANTFHCKVGTMPFTYLGLPLGLKNPTWERFSPSFRRSKEDLRQLLSFYLRLVDYKWLMRYFMCTLKLPTYFPTYFMCTLKLPTYLRLVDYKWSFYLPTYFMCTLNLQKTVIKQIDKFRRHCLWRGADINAKKPPQVAWKAVCKPKPRGLGVINLELQNKALLMKCLHKFFNRANIPWVNIIWANHYSNSLPSAKPVGSFWWKDILKIQGAFKELARVEIGDGKTTLLWHDNWDGLCKSARFPELLSFASFKDVIIHHARLASPNEMFHTPLSAEAFDQLLALQDILGNLQLHDHSDKWLCNASSSLFSSQKAYSHMTGNQPTHPIFSWLWKSKCQPKHKVFFWLLLKDRLNTRSFLRQRSMPLDSFTCDNCILQMEETTIHLFSDATLLGDVGYSWTSVRLEQRTYSIPLVEILSSMTFVLRHCMCIYRHR